MRAKFQTKVAPPIALNLVAVKFHSNKIAISVSVEVVKHDPSKCSVLHLENDVVRDQAVASTTKYEINITVVNEKVALNHRRRR